MLSWDNSNGHLEGKQSKLQCTKVDWEIKLTDSPLLNRTGFRRSHMLLSIKSSSWPNNGTFRRRSRHKCCLMSRLSPSGRSPTRDSSSTPRVAAQRWRSCCRTRSRSRWGSCRRRIHHSRSRMRSCISAFFAVIDCKKTWKSNHNTNRKKTITSQVATI